ncbi:hypothetical protein SLNWT_3049 [Streptomyces albus]|uniref:Uncharacterized protein n=1 Tax=Streptomyces albus (strain ATCC 21838 / DSM 41398 / FERM P-419 / JCM 4703 / NBRC 107858) TaxID=1081613 RepID=A0A0B5EW22_STRA4|nr:hypothetical protein SLNWT_3049 [Streptomyces albus]AOU77734.1 hypothetical protein SLNHY_3043 [Streptomyces albus]AYN33496.1 hypothetical protein DUI70_2995 [Streptomyces albus]
MGRIVVDDEMYVQTGGHFFVELGQEFRELDGSVASVQ